MTSAGETKTNATWRGQVRRAGVEEEVVEDHDDLAVLCDCEFSLAYGNRVLLHNTRLKLKRGKCYGLIGLNGAGKSTLMRSIAASVVEGFPKEIKSVYVECDVSAADADYKLHLLRVHPLGPAHPVDGQDQGAGRRHDALVHLDGRAHLARACSSRRGRAASADITSRSSLFSFFVNNHVCLCWKSPFTFVELNVLRHAMGPRPPCGRHARRAFHLISSLSGSLVLSLSSHNNPPLNR